MEECILNNTVEHFTITLDHSTHGFHEYVKINPALPIEPQLKRRRLYHRNTLVSPVDHNALKHIIEQNASLKVDFGWSFESELQYKTIMKDCVEAIVPRFNDYAGKMFSDLRCSWLGFVPHNSYDKEIYKDLSTYGLVIYNNEIIDFQTEVVKFITGHKIFLQHAILRDEWFRFEFFRFVRKDGNALADAYYQYMEAIHDSTGLAGLPRDFVESQIGCHFLYNPDLFFELLEFSKLKGEIYE